MDKKENSLVDMHLHTNASDGTWTIKELIAEVIDKKIDFFSITDHDTFENSMKALEMVPKNKAFVIGTEISSTYKTTEYHILAYDFNPKDADLLDLLSRNKKIRNEHNEDIIEYVKEYELINNVKDYDEYEADLKRGGWKSLNYLLDKGIVQDLKGYFNLMSISDLKLTFSDPKLVIDTIHKAGGYAILAHPSAYDQDIFDKEFLRTWLSFGIDGIECYSPYLANFEEAKGYVEFCKENNLMISGGSDCHGAFNKRTVGVPKVMWKNTDLNLLFNSKKY